MPSFINAEDTKKESGGQAICSFLTSYDCPNRLPSTHFQSHSVASSDDVVRL